MSFLKDWYLSLERDTHIVQPLASIVRSWTPTDVALIHPQHLYLSPEAHVVDTLVWLPVLTLQFVYGAWLERRDRRAQRLTPVSRTPLRRSALDVCIATLLIACLVFSTISKYERAARETVLMLAPCHIVTALYAYVLLTNDAHRGAWWFNIVSYLSFFTALALAVPDLAGLTPLGHAVFWVHHWALVAAPLYLFWTDRYPLWSRETMAFYWQASGFMGALCCFVVHHVTSLTFSLNVNYMLYPPPGQPIQGRFCKSLENQSIRLVYSHRAHTDLFGLAFAIMILGYINGQWLAPLLRATVLRIKSAFVGKTRRD